MKKMLAMALMLMVATLALAQQAPPSNDLLADPAAFADRHIKALDQQLKLTDQQKARMRLIFANEARRVKAVLDDDSLPSSNKQMQMQQLHQDAFRKVSGVLTPEQRTRMAQGPAESHGDKSPQ